MICRSLGGKKRMFSVSYHEGSNFPRRTRQLAWRACVGLSQSSSQLALQVSTFYHDVLKYLDQAICIPNIHIYLTG